MISPSLSRLAILSFVLARAALAATPNIGPRGEDLLFLDNGAVKVGIDRAKGAAITWLSWSTYPKNTVNIADPGRLIQQSYYAGLRLDRKADGQSKSWSPWSWNPIQGGGVSSWARVNTFERRGDHTLYAETMPKLWDMPNEEAAALMRQWTAFEPAMPNVAVVRCEFIAQRDIAVFSPTATQRWNFGPHGGGASADLKAGPCVHVEPLDRVNLGPKSAYRFRHWLVVGTELQLAARLDVLWKSYSGERAELTNP